MAKQPSQPLKQKVIEIVNQIPRGVVVTYGDVGDYLGFIARTVGWIMASLTEEEMETVPWARVVGANGTIPALKYGFRGNMQIEILKDEGLEFTDTLKIKNFKQARKPIEEFIQV